jgi:hypothetical protein
MNRGNGSLFGKKNLLYTGTRSGIWSLPDRFRFNVGPPGGLPALGSDYGGGYFAGAYSLSGNGAITHLLIIAPKATGQRAISYPPSGLSFRTSQSAITTTTYDGYANQQAMIAIDSSLNTFPAAQFCRNLTIGGYTDWYLPSIMEMEVLYWNLKPSTVADRTSSPSNFTMGLNAYSIPSRANIAWNSSFPAQTSATIFRSGGAQAFNIDGSVNNNAPSYWTSSSYDSNNAYTLTTKNGYGSGEWGYKYDSMNYGSVGDSRYALTCRAIRKISIY